MAANRLQAYENKRQSSQVEKCAALRARTNMSVQYVVAFVHQTLA